MTKFVRSGYQRVSKYGDVHWVRPQSVVRTDWTRSGGGYVQSPFHGLLVSYGASIGWTASFVNPNARCPVCNDPVFYYQNEFGSRVYFDELGPPWPKHPCTDNGAYRTSGGDSASGVHSPDNSPTLRGSDEVEAISRLTDSLGTDREVQFRQRYGASPWIPLLVTKAYRNGSTCLIVTSPCVGPPARPVYLEFESRKNLLRAGDVVFRKGRTVSLFDKKAQNPLELAVVSIRSAREMIERIPSGL